MKGTLWFRTIVCALVLLGAGLLFLATRSRHHATRSEQQETLPDLDDVPPINR